LTPEADDEAMTGSQRQQAQSLQGQTVSVALRDGCRIDEATLVSAGHSRARTLWLYSNRTDVFVPLAEVVDLWQPVHGPRAA
jgi:hypothetical protein